MVGIVIGKSLAGRYKVLRLIGEGGMGAVYEAFDKTDERRVAVKLIRLEHLVRGGEVQLRFTREAMAAKKLDTPHIVDLLDSGTDDESGQPFMVMELLAGSDLQHVLDEIGPLSEQVALRIAAQACAGLSQAHAAGIIHRDVKPANLYLASSGEPSADAPLVVKLLDFGIAKIKMDELGTDGTGLTRTGSMLGTPAYMSPEQAKGLKTIDQRTDIWSLGAVLFQALTGAPPHDAETVGQLIVAICGETPRPVQQVAPWVSPEAATIVQRALRIDPNERYPTAAAMLEDLQTAAGADFTVTRNMLVPLAAEQRARVARRVFVVGTAYRDSGKGRLSDAGVTSSTYLGTTSGFAAKYRAAPPRGPSPGLVLAGVGVAGAALLGYVLLRPGATAANREPALASTTSAAPVGSAAVTAPSADPALALRTVHVSVPDGASVTVSGRSVAVTAGAFELAGLLGTKHPVRVRLGEREIAADVAITEDGAFPERIDVPRPAPSASHRTPQGPSVAKTGAAPTTAPAPQHATKFE